jgi:hypothetical protein
MTILSKILFSCSITIMLCNIILRREPGNKITEIYVHTTTLKVAIKYLYVYIIIIFNAEGVNHSL